MPLPFIIAGLAALGSAAAGTAAAVGTAAATVGAAAATAAGTVAAAGATAVAIGATTKVLIAAGTVFAGFIINDKLQQKLQKAKTEGYKVGYENASSAYELKFHNQVKLFSEQISAMEKEISQSEDNQAEQERMAIEAYKLLNEAIGIIESLVAKGETPHEETTRYHEYLEHIVAGLNEQAA